MGTIIDRSYLTDELLDSLEPEVGETRSWVVGDHEKPADGGWQGIEGQSDFVPYFILTATPSQKPTGDIATPTSDVWFGYAVTTVARSRRGAEKAAMVPRERFDSLQRQQTADGRTIGRVEITRYGGTERLSVEPPMYLITDQFTIYTTK